MTTLMATPRSATALSTLPTATHELIAAARHSLTEALVATAAADRYAAAHLAALRAAAAVLAARGPARRRSRSRVRSVWLVLPEVAGELAEWSSFFAAGARKRVLAEAGVPCVTAREADDLLRDAEAFLERVIAFLQMSHQPMLPTGVQSAGHMAAGVRVTD
ncbi:MAG: SAV_6107 family HEPN domain-containing protein [Candidatus Nanopelagicales bacterium]